MTLQPAIPEAWQRARRLLAIRLDNLGDVLVTTPALHAIKQSLPAASLTLFASPVFPGFCALIDATDLTGTNHTDPMHMAAALKTPVVALFALTNPPEQWGPWQVPHRQISHDVPCRICCSRVCPYGHECLRLVTPDMVVAAARELLHGVVADDGASLSRPTLMLRGGQTFMLGQVDR